MTFSKKAVLFSLLVVLVLLSYSVYDNNRIVVTEIAVEIDGLPAEFEGFTILQISDLHGRRFGPRQQRLIEQINALDYDMIAITGDMNDQQAHDIAPFLELLAGIENRERVFHVSGNSGPYDYDLITGEKKEDGLKLEQAGVTLLDHPKQVRAGDASLWVADHYLRPRAEAMIDVQDQLALARDEAHRQQLEQQSRYYRALKNEFEQIQPEDVLIGVMHYPLSQQILESDNGRSLPPYDLILAGHYHGGQIRVPFYGAVYIPDPLIVRGLFPPQNTVSGANRWGDTTQFVSRGLGASAPVFFLNFRLFNPPELNLIRLVVR